MMTTSTNQYFTASRIPHAHAGCTDCDAAVLSERRRIGHELHDVVGNGIQAALLYLEAARRVPSGDDDGRRLLLVTVDEQLRACWAEVRNCVAGMLPADLVEADLPRALRDYVTRLSTVTEARLTFVSFGTWNPLPVQVELFLLRVAQEAITNALRHAKAKSIDVTLEIDPTSIRLTVCDDGMGFDPTKMPQGFGLLGMRRRAEQLGATLAIDSGPDHGTTISLGFPDPRDAMGTTLAS